LWKMGEMFQLSIELYDTKDSKVVWSDRWQEKWDDLPTIKGSLSDGLLKALNTTSNLEKKVETTNTEAYEYYIKGKHRLEKRENIEDTEISRVLLQKAIKLDDNLIEAKTQLGNTYHVMRDYEKAMGVYIPSLKQAEQLGKKREMGFILNSMGNRFIDSRDFKKALFYHIKSLEIRKEIDDKLGMGQSCNNLGVIYKRKNEPEKALEYFSQSLMLSKEIGDKKGIGISNGNIGSMYRENGEIEKALDYFYRFQAISQEIHNKWGMGNAKCDIGDCYRAIGDYNKALDYFTHSMTIYSELGDKYGMKHMLHNIGIVYVNTGNNETAQEYLEKSFLIKKGLAFTSFELETTTFLYLTYKHLGKDYDEKEIHALIKVAENIEFELNYAIYQLLEDTSYLETAYKQVQDKASAMEEELKAKFLSYPIPKAIVEEWEKVK